jgi:hypothetical protein
MMKFLIPILMLMYYSNSFAESAMQECWYFSKTADEEINEKQCFSLDESLNMALGDAHLSKKVLAQLNFDNDGLNYVRSQSGFFYVNKQGIMRNTLTFDNGADYFSEGLARTRVNGKIGYFDKSLKIIIPAQYDFGFPFENGQAIVCNGCVEQVDGEHKNRVGGLWGTINKQGKVVQKLQPQTK